MISRRMAWIIARTLGDRYPQYRISVIQWGFTDYRFEAVATDLSLPVTAIITSDAGELLRVLRKVAA